VSTRRWYLVETTNVAWPGALSWRGRDAAALGMGYASADDAAADAHRIATHWAATRGPGGPVLSARELLCHDHQPEPGAYGVCRRCGEEC